MNTAEFNLDSPTAVAIGKFDGVHAGHRKLLEEITARKKNGLKACVFTFDPPPSRLFGFGDGRELTTKLEKRKIFEEMGVDILIEFPLTRETAAIAPEDFVKNILAARMKAAFIAAGRDLSFGDKGAGDAALLETMAPGLGFEVRTIEKVCIDGHEVSSTYIRELVEKGEMDRVEKFLHSPYTVVGKIVHGNQIGRTIGFPTLNLIPPEEKLMPPNGVYRTQVYLRGKIYEAISNVGYKPTVTQERVLGLESYLYDFDEEIYDEEIEVYLHSFRRPEKKFKDLEALKSQLKLDILQR